MPLLVAAGEFIQVSSIFTTLQRDEFGTEEAVEKVTPWGCSEMVGCMAPEIIWKIENRGWGIGVRR